ncbi:hypothetical protein FSARC_943 [Fusarium sarcochroum]|uniref:AB hydrolase-1 domain-containing protein n=1 Tax=Fusarium sarcochroum TaxID=1208366 RepID=A0A8H4UAH2_9HYPO|nr:hypothetical protein FSARC_943 [Fusarium sarcochroum]
MVSSKPTIVIVHGGWQRQYQYEALAEGLAEKGFEVLRPENATAGEDISQLKGKTYLDDVDVIRDIIETPLAAGKEIILVCHSYAGIPASAAAEGYQVHERKQKGLAGGIKHVVYLAAVALPAKGLSLLAAIGGSYPPWMEKQGDVITINENGKDALFNDYDSETASRLLAGCVYQGTLSLETPSAFAAVDVGVPKTYVVCELDRAVPVEAQLGMAGALGEGTNIVRVQSGHSVYGNHKVLPDLLKAIEQAADA